jgi:hypothetical protein
MLPASRPLIACRHRFPAHPTFDWLYVFEDDVMLEPRFGQNYQPEDVLCYLSAAEKLATARGSPMIYLDAPSATWRPQPSSKITCARSTNQSMHRHRHGVMEEGSPLLDLSILPCAPICLHAYAIRRQDAADLYGKIRSHLERIGRFSKQFYGYNYYRYNLDVNVRGFFQTNQGLTTLQWPTCIKMSGQGFTGLSSLIVQNASMPKVVGWHGGVRVKSGRRPFSLPSRVISWAPGGALTFLAVKCATRSRGCLPCTLGPSTQ